MNAHLKSDTIVSIYDSILSIGNKRIVYYCKLEV